MKKQLFQKFLSAFLVAALMFTTLPGGVLKAKAASADNDTEIENLPSGSTIQFAGQSWTLLNPSSGLILCDTAVSSGQYGTTSEFIAGNAAYDYLNTAYYNSLTSTAKAFIQSHAWGTGISNATCKIGLLTRNDVSQYGSHIKPLDQNWFLCTALYNPSGPEDEIFYVKANNTGVGNSDCELVSYTAAYRPALYLYPQLKLSYDDTTKYSMIDVSAVSASGNGYTYSNGKITLTGGYTYIVYGSTRTNTVDVQSGVTADVVFAGADIEVGSGSAFSIASGATVNLTLNDNNTLKSGDSNAGLQVSDGATLTITDNSTGSITANGGNTGAGIGGSYKGSGGNVTINGGTVTANGGYYGAGIGGGSYGSGATVTINGGTVTANGGDSGAGVGGGFNGSGANVTVNGGTVTANGGETGAGIGGGYCGSGGSVNVNDGTVTANSGKCAAGIGGGYNASGASVTINGGTVNAKGSNWTAYDYDDNKDFTESSYDIGVGYCGEYKDGKYNVGDNLTVDDKNAKTSQPTVNLLLNGTIAFSSFHNCVVNNTASTEMTGTYNADGYIPVPVSLSANPTSDSKVSLQATVGKSGDSDAYEGTGTMKFSYSSGNGGYTAIDDNGSAVSAAAPAVSVFTPDSGKTYAIRADYSSANGYRKGTASASVSADASLKSLEVSNGELSPGFSSNTNSYTVNVGVNTSSFYIIPTASDAHASIKVNGEAVASGAASNNITLGSTGSDTTINIAVTSQMGNAETYTVKVHRTEQVASNVTVSYVNGGVVTSKDTNIGKIMSYSTGADGGNPIILKAAVEPTNAVQSVDWFINDSNFGLSTENPGNGTITRNSDGTVTFTGTKAGGVLVTAVANDGSGKYANFGLVVTTDKSIVITGSSNCTEGDTLLLSTTLMNVAAGDITWTADADNLNPPADIGPGDGTITDNHNGTTTFEAKKAGYFYVKAVGEGASSVPFLIIINAKDTPETETVTVDGFRLLAIGSTLPLSASVTINGSTQNVSQNVTWSSSDTSIATVDGSGKVTGIKAGKATITATTTDGNSVLGSTDITVGTAPAISTLSLPDGTDGTAYCQTLSAAGDAPIIWNVPSGTLPNGLTLDSDTGKISGTPTTTGNFTFTIQAANPFGTVTKQLSIQIEASAPAPAAPTITIQESPVKSFLHFVTFGLFFGDTIHVSFSSQNSSNIDHYEYQTVASDSSYNAGNTWTKADSFSISPDFKGSVYARAVSKNGAYSDVTAEALVVDKTKPVISAVYSEADDKISVGVTDNGSGIDTITYKISDETVQAINLEPTETKDITTSRNFEIGSLPNGKYDVAINAVDNSGNIADTKTIQVVQGPITENVSVTPSTAAVQKGGTQTFSAAVTGENNPAQTVTWSVSGNNSTNTKINPSGVLTIGSDETAATLTVKASSTIDNSKYGTATLMVTAVTPPSPTVSNVTVTPSTAAVQKGGTQTFSAAVTGENNPAQTVTWSVSGNNSTNTKIDSSGVLTIGSDETAATLTVKASSTIDNSKYGTATLMVTAVTPPSPTVNNVKVTPSTATVQKGGAQTFSAAVIGNNNPAQTVTWSVDGKSSANTEIDGDGKLTVGTDETAATLTVKASSTIDNSKYGTATVTVTAVTPPTSIVTGVTVTPSTATVLIGDIQTFSAAVNGVNNPSQVVTWGVIGNNSNNTKISNSGVLTIGNDETAATLTIRASSTENSTKSGTAAVTVKKAKYLTGISMQTPPEKINYVEGRSLDITGATLSLKYSDNSSDVIAVQSTMVSGFDCSKTGLQTVTVSYHGKSTSFSVIVIPKIITNKENSATVDLSDVVLPSGVTSVTVGGGVLPDSGSNTLAYENVNAFLVQNNGGFSIGGVSVLQIELFDQNGTPVKYFGKVKVSLPIPQSMSGNLHVYWYNPADGTLTDMNATQENGYLVFEITHFSYYAIAQLTASANVEKLTEASSASGNTGSSTPDGIVPNPKTGSNDWPLIPLAVLGGGMATGAVIIKRRRFFRIKKKA